MSCQTWPMFPRAPPRRKLPPPPVAVIDEKDWCFWLGTAPPRGVRDPGAATDPREAISFRFVTAHGAHGGHGHGHGAQAHGGHGHAHAGGAGALLPALVLTTAFMLVEAGVGFWTHSLALVADAGHMLADAGALALALVAQRIAARPRTERSTCGYRRAGVLAAFANGMVLAGVAVLVLKEASERYLSPV